MDEVGKVRGEGQWKRKRKAPADEKRLKQTSASCRSSREAKRLFAMSEIVGGGCIFSHPVIAMGELEVESRREFKMMDIVGGAAMQSAFFEAWTQHLRKVLCK